MLTCISQYIIYFVRALRDALLKIVVNGYRGGAV